jgi:hypothetical protein
MGGIVYGESRDTDQWPGSVLLLRGKHRPNHVGGEISAISAEVRPSVIPELVVRTR